MVVFCINLDAEVSIDVSGKNAIESEIPFPGAPFHDAPTSSYKLTEVEELTPFSVNISLGAGFCRLVDPLDRDLMILIQMDGLEIMRRPITRRGFENTESPTLCRSYQGVLDWTAGETSRMRIFDSKD